MIDDIRITRDEEGYLVRAYGGWDGFAVFGCDNEQQVIDVLTGLLEDGLE